MVESTQVRIEDICSPEVFKQAWLQIHKGLDREGLVLDVVLNMDYEADLEANLRRLLRRLSGHAYHPCPCREVPSAKGNGLTRPVVVLDIEDAIVCQAIAWRLAPVLDSKLTPSVYSMRATKNRKKPFEDWYDEWPKYQKRIRGMLANSADSCLVVTDITAFFDNLDLRILKALMLEAGVSLEVSDLLTFMIESWVYRPPYGVPMGRGIPQADWDLPRALANFYLHPHDARVRAECGDNYARWVDDMNAVVGSKVEGKKLIGVLNQSLRRLFLSANAGKTEVLSGLVDISAYFWFEENDFLDEIETKIRQAAKGELARAPVLRELKRRYVAFRNSKHLGNWEKVLKRYFTMFKRINSDYLVAHMRSYLNDMPQLDQKVSDYVLGIDYSPEAAGAIIDYLESDENMYPSVEMRLLETLLRLRVPMSKDPIAKRICDLGQSLAYGKGPHQNKHWYSRSLGVLLIAKYGKDNDTRKLARLLMESGEHFDPEFKKHLLATALTLTAEKEVKEVVQFAKRQHDRELSRLTHFYEGLIDRDEETIPEAIRRRLVLKQTESPTRRFRSILRKYPTVCLLCVV